MALRIGLPFWRGETMIALGAVRLVRGWGLGWIMPFEVEGPAAVGFEALFSLLLLVERECRSGFWLKRAVVFTGAGLERGGGLKGFKGRRLLSAILRCVFQIQTLYYIVPGCCPRLLPPAVTLDRSSPVLYNRLLQLRLPCLKIRFIMNVDERMRQLREAHVTSRTGLAPVEIPASSFGLADRIIGTATDDPQTIAQVAASQCHESLHSAVVRIHQFTSPLRSPRTPPHLTFLR